MNYVYIVECSDGTFYTGWTVDLEKRIKSHSSGKGAKYTRGRGPVKLLYYEKFNNKSDAMKREYEIKRLNRQQKEILIKSIENKFIMGEEI
ncbi:GIY-YIG nuclease family protein [Clostridium sp. CTA-5]